MPGTDTGKVWDRCVLYGWKDGARVKSMTMNVQLGKGIVRKGTILLIYHKRILRIHQSMEDFCINFSRSTKKHAFIVLA